MPYALIDWVEDGLSSVINLTTVISPRKELCLYQAGEQISAKFGGQVYGATIVMVSDDKKILDVILNKKPSEPLTSSSKKQRLDNNNNISAHDTPVKNRSPKEKKQQKKGTSAKKAPVCPDKKQKKKIIADNEKTLKRKHQEEIEAYLVSTDDDTTEIISDSDKGSSDDEDASISGNGHPQYEEKRPKLTPGCINCESVTSQKEDLELDIERIVAERDRLQKEVKSLEAKLAQHQRRADQLAVPQAQDHVENEDNRPRAGLVKRSIAEEYKMVELMPGSGVFMFPQQLQEAGIKNTVTSRARTLMSCFWTNKEMIDAGRLASLSESITKQIAIFVCKDVADCDRAKEFANVKRHMRNKVTFLLALHKKGQMSAESTPTKSTRNKGEASTESTPVTPKQKTKGLRPLTPATVDSETE